TILRWHDGLFSELYLFSCIETGSFSGPGGEGTRAEVLIRKVASFEALWKIGRSVRGADHRLEAVAQAPHPAACSRGAAAHRPAWHGRSMRVATVRWRSARWREPGDRADTLSRPRESLQAR